MSKALTQESLRQLFTDARTHHAWLNKEVNDHLLHELYELTKWGPTSLNSLPARFLFIKSASEKARLVPALAGTNTQQVQEAPVTVIVAYDEAFYNELPVLFPAFDAKSMFVSNAPFSEQTAFRNGSLQGAYLILAARALGLDVGPMSGFDNAIVDETFFKGTSWKSNFLCNVGYGDASKLYPRGPRLSFEQACKIV
jgi:3-hydroxypropanoate dehydrogenase